MFYCFWVFVKISSKSIAGLLVFSCFCIAYLSVIQRIRRFGTVSRGLRRGVCCCEGGTRNQNEDEITHAEQMRHQTGNSG